MNATLIIDASAAVRIVIGPSPASLVAAVNAAREVVAPALFPAEVANALWKYVRAGLLTAADATIRLRAATEHCGRILPWSDLASPDSPTAPGSILTEALSEANRLNHPVYDLIYLVTARRYTATLVTCDHRLAALATSQGIAVIQE